MKSVRLKDLKKRSTVLFDYGTGVAQPALNPTESDPTTVTITVLTTVSHLK
ncbi:hypothetical protein GS399_05195 [Pedobacter sp. HMF7647]|uniref:Uncharacterized protein n=1 Tax=Hufsiella arboris TaxID=2695275 RepID=A0A7K1Y7E1_9SPHI|nr:hypothetical protein [Hufsiella arboris]MXV50360.1 hypothetical protein [Hufsiella arboris]